MIASIVLGVAIFGYAAYAFSRHIQKSKQGKCAACAVKEACQAQESSCSTIVR